MSDYEIRVAGRIGPLVASIFPEFRATVVADSVLLSGTVPVVENVLGVIEVLRAHGLTPIDTVVTPQRFVHTVSADGGRQHERGMS